MIVPLEGWTTQIFMPCFSGLFFFLRGIHHSLRCQIWTTRVCQATRNTSDHFRTRWLVDVWFDNFMFSHVAKLLNSEDFWKGYMLGSMTVVDEFASLEVLHLRSWTSSLEVHLIKRNHGWEKGIFRGWNPQLGVDYNIKPIIRIPVPIKQ